LQSIHSAVNSANTLKGTSESYLQFLFTIINDCLTCCLPKKNRLSDKPEGGFYYLFCNQPV
jgi:hypothetical protein